MASGIVHQQIAPGLYSGVAVDSGDETDSGEGAVGPEHCASWMKSVRSAWT